MNNTEELILDIKLNNYRKRVE